MTFFLRRPISLLTSQPKVVTIAKSDLNSPVVSLTETFVFHSDIRW